MNTEIKELSSRLHTLYEKIMVTDPWEEGYGEVAAIHEELLKVLRDKAQKDFEEFKKYLTETSKDIEEKWKSNSSHISKWIDTLSPVFEQIEVIVGNAVPLLKLLR